MTVPPSSSDSRSADRRFARVLLAAATCALVTASGLHVAAAADAWSFIQPAGDAARSGDQPAEAGPDAPEAQIQDSRSQDSKSQDLRSQDLRSQGADSQEAALPDPATVDWSLLNADPSTWRAAPDRRSPGVKTGKADATASAWSRSDKPAGFASFTVKQPVLPFWDARVGADLTVAGQSSLPEPLPEKLATDSRLSQSSGTAWAAMTAPGLGSVWDKTAVEARVDPSQEQSKFGTSISKSLPLDGNAYSLTLQGGYNVIEQTLVPLVGANGRPPRTVEADRAAKFSINGTGTSLLAGESLSSAEDRWLRSVGAEQKLFDGVSISGKVSETIAGNLNKSLTAGFKKTW